MHVFHQPLPVLEEMDIDDLLEWAEEAKGLFKAIYRSR